MNFENSFMVPVAPADAWKVMMDFERVAPCMPGAEVTERTGENAFKVQVRVKVGPMSMTYRGQAEIIDRDDATMTAAMRVDARETRGQGSANAVVRMKLATEGVGTHATMATELRLSGRAAAMGRGVITDVSNALVSEFADNLAQMLAGEPGDGAGVAEEGAPGAPDQPAGPEGPPGPGAAGPGGAGALGPGAARPGAAGPPGPGAAGPQGPGAAAPPPPPSSTDALNAGQLVRTVVISRLREPRTAVLTGGALSLACLTIGFRLGRRAGRRW